MTKTDEVKRLDQTIATFGAASYLGPWLAEYRAQLVADIENDLPPSAPMPSAARHEAAELIAAADRRATDILEAAKKKAQAIEDEAIKFAGAVRERSIRHLLSAIRELEK